MTSRPVPISLAAPSSKDNLTISEVREFNHASTEIVYAEQVSGELESYWLGLQKKDERYGSPYYHPQFVRAVAAVRDDVEIALLRNASGNLIGVFPYQRIAATTAVPIGGRMNDFHGVIAPIKMKIDLKLLLNDLKLKRFNFHALASSDDVYTPFEFETICSYYVDLSAGYQEYSRWLYDHSTTIKRLRQKARALARDAGPVVFEFESNNSQVLERLIEMKRDKFQRTNTFDILSVPWAADLLREISSSAKNDFRGIMSALWAGDQLVAAHFGMVSNDVLHYWFPAYDNQYSKYSAGLQLMQETCRAAAQSGIRRIDMSYGKSDFKSKFCNGSGEVRFGLVDENPITFGIARQRYFMRQSLKHIPLKQNFKYLLRKVFPGYGRWHFR